MFNLVYFGFALADSMFDGNCEISRRELLIDTATGMINAPTTIPCLNPSHIATINAMNSRFGISVEIPPFPPQVHLQKGDSIIVMGVRGLPRLTDRHEYTQEEVDGATFTFNVYTVV